MSQVDVMLLGNCSMHCPTTVLPVHKLWLQVNRTQNKLILGPLIFFQKLHCVVGYIVYFSNILLFLIIIIVLGEICSVPMKYPG